MPNPKRRHSKTRGRKRRTGWAMDAMNIIPCASCQQPKMPHHICPHCGKYKGREVLDITPA